MTDDERSRLIAAVQPFRNVLDPDFAFPSRHALTRYVTSFFEGFHSHMPFIHGPTWRLSDHPPELILGIASLGCQYCFEHRNSERMFHAGKAILIERVRHQSEQFGPRTRSYLGFNDSVPVQSSVKAGRAGTAAGNWAQFDPMGTIRALIALMGYATWEPKVSLLQEAFTLQGLLAQALRDVGLSEEGQADSSCDYTSLDTAWRTWIACECTRRAKLIAFSFLHTHSIAYNVYPVLRSNEINLRLPCSTGEWKAPSATQWRTARQAIAKEQLFFQDALSLLLKRADGAGALDPIPTPLGNYVLLHGLLQRIFIIRDLSLPVMHHSAALPPEEVDKLE